MLIDTILHLKGYREFNPVYPTKEVLDTEEQLKQWQEESELKEEGFEPY